MRSFLITFFCFLWISALLAPALLLYVEDSGITMVQPLHEEEHEEDSELEFENPFLKAELGDRVAQYFNPNLKANGLAEKNLASLLPQEILLPPPKHS